MPFSMAENETIRHPWILCHSQWQRMLYVLNIAFSATIRRHDARTIDLSPMPKGYGLEIDRTLNAALNILLAGNAPEILAMHGTD